MYCHNPYETQSAFNIEDSDLNKKLLTRLEYIYLTDKKQITFLMCSELINHKLTNESVILQQKYNIDIIDDKNYEILYNILMQKLHDIIAYLCKDNDPQDVVEKNYKNFINALKIIKNNDEMDIIEQVSFFYVCTQ